VSLYNTFITHTHAVADLVGQDTFGNLGVYGGGGTWLNKTSGVVSGAPSSSDTVASEDNIDAIVVNALILDINNIRTHTHEIIDDTA